MTSQKATIPVISPSFPCLMEHSSGDFIVLFYDTYMGTVVYKSETTTHVHKIGLFCKDWEIKVFHPFKGIITLQN